MPQSSKTKTEKKCSLDFLKSFLLFDVFPPIILGEGRYLLELLQSNKLGLTEISYNIECEILLLKSTTSLKLNLLLKTKTGTVQEYDLLNVFWK